MNKNADIDRIFKDGLGEKNFAGKDAMWQKLEHALDENNKKRKRRIAFIMLFASILTTGFFILNNQTTGTSASPMAEINTKPQSLQVETSTQNSKVVIPGSTNVSANTITGIQQANTAKKPLVISQKKRFIVKTDPAAVETINTAELMQETKPGNNLADDDYTEAILREKISFQPELIVAVPAMHTVQPVVATTKLNTALVLDEKKKVQEHTKKISIELLAGTDAFRMNRKAGYYAGIRVNKLLDEGTVVSFGVNYANNTVNDRYRLAAKPADRGETDAKINDIHTLRFPVYFQRQLAKSKFALYAGLVPSYVVDAMVYNVPNSFTGNPDEYRKFTMKDINRLNILFGAGIKFSPVKRVALELSGSYGFTGLVKNSYINQSRVNDNFKNIQAGLVFMLK